MSVHPHFFSARWPRRLGHCGYSITEILVVITVIGIMAAIAIPMIIGGVDSTNYATAMGNLEHLNAAVRKYNSAVKELTNAVGDDEAVLTELKIDGSVDARPGSPYLQTNLGKNMTSDTSTYRGVWGGHEFQLIGPETNGTGVDLLNL